ncbi:acylneuraminate cytidylyltransferase family protein [Thalassotalea sp. LPB0316]|uniref:acylneuraminate cytidylyltransferase family protein n=1 Tax=Thalassotalea sp. LPB0316 TaxID=2769490 RepID=UPI0018665053|nr:acylneuraminate cytidylyltransferase family protein [Thalassotalea sp. LPB0316]QOL27085.1 acylneuraminate cytidylyltransferase family protein [Thalassotalea sp. LPB0316]
MTEKSYAFIFARGGSKGLPGKNIKPLNGKPLIAYSIDTALQTKCFEKVFVSTDDSNIADVAKKYGAEVIDRPAQLATDKSPEWLSWQHAIEYVEGRYGAFEQFVSLPATSPLRSAQDVIDAMTKRKALAADICISVTEASRSPYFNMVRLDNDWCRIVIAPDSDLTRRQDAPEVFDITTVVYATTPTFIKHNQGLFDGQVCAITVPKERAVDIDDIYDFYFAKAILEAQGQ